MSAAAILPILSGIAGVVIGPQLLDLLRVPEGMLSSTSREDDDH